MVGPIADARAALFQECFVRRTDSLDAYWIVLEPIELQTKDSTDQVVRFLARGAENAARSAVEQLHANGVDFPLSVIDCWDKRRRANSQLQLPSLDDFNRPAVDNFLSEHIVAVTWGDSPSVQGGVMLQFAILPRLGSPLAQDASVTLSSAQPLQPPLDAERDVNELMKGIKIVPMVAILAGVDDMVADLRSAQPHLKMVDAHNHCRLDTLSYTLTWAETQVKTLGLTRYPAWLSDWTRQLREDLANLAKEKPNADCVPLPH